MSSWNLIRWAGLAAMVGGVVYVGLVLLAVVSVRRAITEAGNQLPDLV